MTDITPIPVLSAEEWDAKMKAPVLGGGTISGPLVRPSEDLAAIEERLRVLREVFLKRLPLLPYVSENELLYGKPYPEGKWEDIAADVPLSQRGFGT